MKIDNLSFLQKSPQVLCPALMGHFTVSLFICLIFISSIDMYRLSFPARRRVVEYGKRNIGRNGASLREPFSTHVFTKSRLFRSQTRLLSMLEPSPSTEQTSNTFQSPHKIPPNTYNPSDPLAWCKDFGRINLSKNNTIEQGKSGGTCASTAFLSMMSWGHPHHR